MSTDIEFDAHCPTCGEVRLTGDELWLVLTPGDVTDHFAFRCPRCCDHVRCPVDDETAEVLARHWSGANPETRDVSAPSARSARPVGTLLP
jgi:hypothetical protein